MAIKTAPVQMPLPWIRFLRKRKEKTGVPIYRIITEALEAKYGNLTRKKKEEGS